MLDRVITFKSYVSLGLGAMIGMGWVVFTGKWLEAGGPLGAVLGFVIGGLMLVPVGKVYAELTPAIPVAGGEIAFSYKAFGPNIAFVSAWLLALGYGIICPFETVAIGWLLEHIAPGMSSEPLYTVGGASISLTTILSGVLVGILVVLLNWVGVKVSTKFQMIATSLMLLCTLAFVLVAFIAGNPANLLPLFARSHEGISHVTVSVLSVVVVVPFWMSGFDAIPQAAEESGMKDGPRKLGFAILISIVVAIVFYSVVILAVAMSAPWQSSVKLDMPTSEVFEQAFGYRWAAKLVLVAAMLGLITSLNGFFLAATRILFSAGRGGLLPKWFAHIDDRHHTPTRAIIFVGLLSLIGPFVGKASLVSIVHVGSFAFVAAWFIACLSAIALRKKAPDLVRPYKVKRKSTLYLAALISVILALFFVVPGSPEILVWPYEPILVVAWVLIGAIFYIIRRRKNDLSKPERDRLILGKYR